MTYAVLITILLLSGKPHTYQVNCSNLTCVAYLMVASNEGQQLSRFRVARGDPGILSGSGKRTVFPPLLDLHYH